MDVRVLGVMTGLERSVHYTLDTVLSRGIDGMFAVCSSVFCSFVC